MYKHIILDFFQGIVNSIRIDFFVKPLFDNTKLKKLVFKIIKYNALLHFIPYILVVILEWLLGVSLFNIFIYIICPVNIFSAMFHILHYMDLVNMVSSYSSKTSNTGAALDMLSMTITMTIYQLVIYLTTSIINIVFHDRLHILAIIINFAILTIYHSFYCFNNLWQYKKIEMFYRIDMHEKLWPFYVGYGLVSTIIYFYINNAIMLGIYNLYMTLAIALPFLMNTKYPKKDMPYPSINLFIFSYLTGFIFTLSKNILKTSK
ncbi:putative etoposide-induced protein 2.4 [Tupanvirus soda lake]|uniref:Etoposide-induced protein 2.4 n=2 Tax=Tupanvirus TaxID=2094720 RepID=A0AC62ADA5_9VIRU|nr:putative etoposide-induced protein 2.4 [Tupanvirus soda lake]QKU35593.1 putative etoposide-induced protein 2.4 [Tupanvirus soda lake]